MNLEHEVNLARTVISMTRWMCRFTMAMDGT